jgi:two-component system chemotaxis response regulator CheB
MIEASSHSVAPPRRVKVLIVDDSAMVRRILSELLARDHGIEVVGTAPDAYVAREKIKHLAPDVLTLDVEMPRMDGLTFLRNLMRLRPMPVVMVSSLTDKGAESTLEALSIGAVDFLHKPRNDVAATLANYEAELRAKVRAAATARVRAYSGRPQMAVVPPRLNADAVLAKTPARFLRTTDKLIAMGASTGGTEALREVLEALPADSPGVVIAQHIPKTFSTAFARRLDSYCQVTVCEAEDNQQILPGHVYIAPGDRHLLVRRNGARYVCRLDDGPPVNRHKPSVDVLFRSVAQQAGRNAVGVLLTGMGRDGAVGLKEMLDVGCQTIAQDERTSVVWGMPGEAVALGAAKEIVSLGAIAGRMLALAAQLATEDASASGPGDLTAAGGISKT